MRDLRLPASPAAAPLPLRALLRRNRGRLGPREAQSARGDRLGARPPWAADALTEDGSRRGSGPRAVLPEPRVLPGASRGCALQPRAPAALPRFPGPPRLPRQRPCEPSRPRPDLIPGRTGRPFRVAPGTAVGPQALRAPPPPPPPDPASVVRGRTPAKTLAAPPGPRPPRLHDDGWPRGPPRAEAEVLPWRPVMHCERNVAGSRWRRGGRPARVLGAARCAARPRLDPGSTLPRARSPSARSHLDSAWTPAQPRPDLAKTPDCSARTPIDVGPTLLGPRLDTARTPLGSSPPVSARPEVPGARAPGTARQRRPGPQPLRPARSTSGSGIPHSHEPLPAHTDCAG